MTSHLYNSSEYLYEVNRVLSEGTKKVVVELAALKWKS